MQTSNTTARFLSVFRRSETGGALLELAVVFPILLLVSIGVADYARVYVTSIKVANAAEAAAQYGAYSVINSADSAGIVQRARDDAGDASLQATTTSVCRCTSGGAVVVCTDACGTYADGVPQLFVQVNVSKDVNLFLNYLGLPQTITVRDSATFRAR